MTWIGSLIAPVMGGDHGRLIPAVGENVVDVGADSFGERSIPLLIL